MYVSIGLSVDISVCLSIYLLVHLFVCFVVCLSICLSVCWSAGLSVCQSVSLSVCLSIYISMSFGCKLEFLGVATRSSYCSMVAFQKTPELKNHSVVYLSKVFCENGCYDLSRRWHTYFEGSAIVLKKVTKSSAGIHPITNKAAFVDSVGKKLHLLATDDPL